MKTLTQQETICAALIKRGCAEVTSKTKKARCFTIKPNLSSKFIFVGKKGSIRIGTGYSNSRPISDKVKRSLSVAN